MLSFQIYFFYVWWLIMDKGEILKFQLNISKLCLQSHEKTVIKMWIPPITFPITCFSYAEGRFGTPRLV